MPPVTATALDSSVVNFDRSPDVTVAFLSSLFSTFFPTTFPIEPLTSFPHWSPQPRVANIHAGELRSLSLPPRFLFAFFDRLVKSFPPLPPRPAGVRTSISESTTAVRPFARFDRPLFRHPPLISLGLVSFFHSALLDFCATASQFVRDVFGQNYLSPRVFLCASPFFPRFPFFFPVFVRFRSLVSYPAVGAKKLPAACAFL